MQDQVKGANKTICFGLYNSNTGNVDIEAV